MKLLILTQYFWPEAFRINDLVIELRRQGVETEVLTGQPNYPGGQIFQGYRAWSAPTEDYQGIAVHRVPLFARGQRSAIRLALNYLSFVISASLFGPWKLRGRQYDAILVFAPSPILQALPALLIGRLRRIPVALWVQDLWPESLAATGYVRNLWVLGGIEKIVRFIYRRTDRLLVQSEAFRSPVMRTAGGRNAWYLPNPMDAVFAQEASGTEPGPTGERPFTVLFAGNIGNAQAVEVIVSAATQLRHRSDIHFVLAGDGSRLEWMQEEARRLGLTNVEFLGRLPVSSMPQLMASADALMVTLTDDPIFRLTVPSKVQAYLAAGRPLIASLAGEGARVVEEAQAGLTVPPMDPPALVGAIEELCAMSDAQRAWMGNNGRRYAVEHFALDRVATSLIKHVGEMANITGDAS